MPVHHHGLRSYWPLHLLLTINSNTMTIHIDDTRTIEQLQEDFNKVFPLLKLEFFKKPHASGSASEKSELLPACSTLRSWRSIHDAGDIVITAKMTVAEVEKSFSTKFGLHAQIFRLSGRAWLQTTVTDQWTLEQQNEAAEQLQHPAE